LKSNYIVFYIQASSLDIMSMQHSHTVAVFYVLHGLTRGGLWDPQSVLCVCEKQSVPLGLSTSH